MIKKESLIKKVSTSAKISIKEATKAYETILKESPSFRTQTLKDKRASLKKAPFKKVEVIKEIPVAIVKTIEKIKKVEVIKEIPVEVLVEVIKEVTLIKEVEIPVEVISDKATFAKLKKENKSILNQQADLEAEIKKLEAAIKRLQKKLDEKPKEIIHEVEVIKEVEKVIVKEVEVIKEYDMKEMMAMLKKAATKQGARKVVGETTTKGASKIVDRREVGSRDKLTKIEGIGPKIQELLNQAGIYSFKHLADTAVPKLSKILENAGSRFQMHNPGTWPKQSKMAADGAWEQLKKWQDELDGGK